MNKLEMSSYCEPDFNIYYDEFINEEMTEEKRKIAEEKTIEMYANFTDDDWRALGDNY